MKLGLFVVLSLSMTAHAHSPERSLPGTCESHALPIRVGAGAEIEILTADRVLPWLTTTDGTIRPIVMDRNAIPKRLRVSFQRFLAPNSDILDMPWHALNSDEQKALILSAAKFHGQRFQNDRAIHGLRIKEQLRLKFHKPVRMLGRDLTAGEHTFNWRDISSVGSIEFSGPRAMVKDLGFEIHVGDTLPPTETFWTARALEVALGLGPANIHVHILTRLKRSTLDFASPQFVQRFGTNGLTEYQFIHFLTLITMYFDFKMIERKIPSEPIAAFDGSFRMYPSDPVDLSKFGLHLIDGSDFRESKGGTVGMRGVGFYRDKDAIGIELRYLSPALNQTQLAKAIDYISRVLTEGRYPIGPTELNHIFSRLELPEEDIVNRVLSLSPGLRRTQTVKSELSKLSELEIQGLVTGLIKNAHVKYLLHDYTLMFGLPELDQNRITSARTQAIKLMAHDGYDPREALAYFIKKSGLARSVFRRFENP